MCVQFLILLKPSKKSIKLWTECAEWLILQEVKIIVDFDDVVKFKYQISTDDKYLRERKDRGYEYYKKIRRKTLSNDL